jgi:hypothetical protein
MCKVKFVEVSQVFKAGKAVGMQYLDNQVDIDGFTSIEEAFNMFKSFANSYITDNQSVILCRDDVKHFCKSVNKTVGNSGSCKLLFSDLKDYLYEHFEVKRIILNPRTLEYYPLNKAFIINKL